MKYNRKHSYNNSETEQIAYKQLKRMGCKHIVQLDAKKELLKSIQKGILTPDFIIGKDTVNLENFINTPSDFYLDVAELTGAFWNQENGKHPILKDSNIIDLMNQGVEVGELKKVVQNYSHVVHDNVSYFSMSDATKVDAFNNLENMNQVEENTIAIPADVTNKDLVNALWNSFDKKIKKYEEAISKILS